MIQVNWSTFSLIVSDAYQNAFLRVSKQVETLGLSVYVLCYGIWQRLRQPSLMAILEPWKCSLKLQRMLTWDSLCSLDLLFLALWCAGLLKLAWDSPHWRAPPLLPQPGFLPYMRKHTPKYNLLRVVAFPSQNNTIYFIQYYILHTNRLVTVIVSSSVSSVTSVILW